MQTGLDSDLNGRGSSAEPSQAASKGASPLAALLRQKSQSAEHRRLNRLTKLLGGFHLKGMIVDPPRQGQLRSLVQGDEIKVNFSSGNYLGLDVHPEVLEACIEGIKTWAGHPGSSRIFYSHKNAVLLEQELATFVGAEASMLAVNVSQAHQGVVPVLFGNRHTTIFIDKHAHTSMYMASLIAKAKGARICRVDIRKGLTDLSNKIQRDLRPTKVLMLDGLFSMQGDVPQLVPIQQLCRRQNMVLYVDDAHGIGILGENGGGVAQHFNLNFENLILIGSLQKGLACSGGFVAGSKALIDLLKLQSTSYIFSGPLQPHTIESIRAAVRVCMSGEGQRLRENLKQKSHLLRAELIAMGFDVERSESPIVPIPIGDDAATMYAGRLLYDLGFYVSSVCYPAVPKGAGILRVTVNSCHTDKELADLISACGHLRAWLLKGRWQKKWEMAKDIFVSNLSGPRYKGILKPSKKWGA
ncbi:MAG: aminotransferase class I/II-fold pyridoxal phosphate-dependent enzyme [Pseudobdellovibrionaceae bacterium]|nr:aminotransferase class I/II-fold pyridoxal phosphate-dependent enzyme [Bdellovibrionales bacterium]USN47485.1 MAG: aminotransferase class I/II-fold pyridoxal phosphate-dependent enzyme [Pseudobdellovibrionaceae bacterium]